MSLRAAVIAGVTASIALIVGAAAVLLYIHRTDGEADFD